MSWCVFFGKTNRLISAGERMAGVLPPPRLGRNCFHLGNFSERTTGSLESISERTTGSLDNFSDCCPDLFDLLGRKFTAP